MEQIPLHPRAILHFDGDSFFAAVEQAMNYRLRGKPVITGGERGAATALSYEAKKLGLCRGMSLREIKFRCPEAIIVPSDYTSYAIFAHRMYAIVRSYTPLVEEYSIDECFADITGLDRAYEKSYEEIALMIKQELEDSLGITFGVGLSLNKSLAKAASKAHKPAGFTSVPFEKIPEFLSTIDIQNIWGFGGVSGAGLRKRGADTALKFSEKSDEWLREHHLGKVYRDIWLELQGHYVNQLSYGDPSTSSRIGSLMVTRTFKPPSNKRSVVFSYLSKNVERVCEKARHHKVQARAFSFYLKTQEFTYHSVSEELTVPTTDASELLEHINKRFDEVFVPGVLYRASGITLRSLVAGAAYTPDLFGESKSIERKTRLFTQVDSLNKRYGKQTVFLASSLQALVLTAREADERPWNKAPIRQLLALGLEKKHKTLRVPFLGIVH